MKRVSFIKMKDTIAKALIKKGYGEEKALESANLFATSSLEGVHSHGLNRVPRLINYIENGWININGEPILIDSNKFIKRYNGDLGPGDLNAKYCMDQAINLAQTETIGVVTLNNTNHWMRGGNYGWQAVKAGFIGICWTNTESSMPPWGSKEPKVGNNPLVLGVPNLNQPVVLDTAMSQFSYGKLQVTRLNNETLPVDGGFNKKGQPTKIPEEIEQTKRLLPMGYWKGSGLTFLLDLIVSILSGGRSTANLDELKPEEHVSGYGVSQIFIAINPESLSGKQFTQEVVDNAISHMKDADLAEGFKEINFPGENTTKRRKENMEKGIPVDSNIWEKVSSYT